MGEDRHGMSAGDYAEQAAGLRHRIAELEAKCADIDDLLPDGHGEAGGLSLYEKALRAGRIMKQCAALELDLMKERAARAEAEKLAVWAAKHGARFLHHENEMNLFWDYENGRRCAREVANGSHDEVYAALRRAMGE